MENTSVARQLIQTSTRASLGTLTEFGTPFVSFVTVAATSPSTVVMLLSGLAKHTKHLTANPNCSLLLIADHDETEDVMQGARLTLTGQVRQISRDDDAEARAAFLDRNPSASMYSRFGDFAFYEFEITEAHLVAGFGRIQTLSPDQL